MFTVYVVTSKVFGGLLDFMLQMSPSLRTQYAIAPSLARGLELAEQAMLRMGIEFETHDRAA